MSSDQRSAKETKPENWHELYSNEIGDSVTKQLFGKTNTVK